MIPYILNIPIVHIAGWIICIFIKEPE